ncbi:MAG: copper amine oxidase N-terminal domain-containing protein [Peptostreptococcaceae bacterium]|jgi:hypothetical protein|nr:copper amine oxidase N-terminal domain-containing protein [Peptostreptococcaceae bacterium]
MKRFLASTMILGLSLGSLSNLAFASEEIVNTKENISIELEDKVANDSFKNLSKEILTNDEFDIDNLVINIDGNKLDSKFKSFIQNDTIMVPLSDIATKLRFNVVWNDDLKQIDINKGAIFTSIKNNENRYFFSKMAPRKLNAAPKIINGTTYVPVEFFSEILRTNSDYDSKNLILNLGLNDKDTGNNTDMNKEEGTNDNKPLGSDEIKTTVNDDNISVEGYINNITTTDRGTKMVQVGSFQKGVILLVDDDTKIIDASGNLISFDNLKENSKIQATHSMVMTMSLPGQTKAFEIKVLN